ncbi:MAG: amino acid transporter [Acidobacteria bacterium 13_1_20CM_4_56_7]|nr:MAG: amino acid transporter [Acidobacteria bacterium 13_1_20CM_4_56_7]PYV50890.1 MAG: APC family permease [Acidobacteriota bacterium]
METATVPSPPRLKRVLTLWDLIFYGIVLIQPIAPVPLYGVAQKLSDGHFVTIILIALFAMLITAVSYGRMAALYPTAGSAYTYVGKGLNPHLGFLAGWAMILDYLLQPLINTVWISTAMHERYTPMVPYIVWAAIIAGIMTLLNLAGVKTSAHSNKVLLAIMSAVVVIFVVLAVRFLYRGQGWHGLFSIEPLYNPHTFNAHRILTATSFAALTYIGFDGVTTLAEDVENPKRNVLLAVVLTCIFAGVCSAFEAYLGARIWPDWRSFPNLETAFMDICRRVGGAFLFNAMGFILIVAAFGSGLTGTLGAARLLFGMGRDGVLPRKTFGYLKPGSSTPTFNILLIGFISFAGAVLLNYVGSAYEHAGELLNFGAFLAFMGVNFAAFWQFTVARQPGYQRKILRDTVLPLIGFAFCALIWWNLNPLAKTVGGIWFAMGLLYVGIKTRGFRAAPVMIDFREA